MPDEIEALIFSYLFHTGYTDVLDELSDFWWVVSQLSYSIDARTIYEAYFYAIRLTKRRGVPTMRRFLRMRSRYSLDKMDSVSLFS